jgi:hypothetical protein
LKNNLQTPLSRISICLLAFFIHHFPLLILVSCFFVCFSNIIILVSVRVFHHSHLIHRACVDKSPVDDCVGDFRGGGGGQGRRIPALFPDRAEHAAVRHGMLAGQ